ncbi:UDP-N-acetylmuramoylalanine--D-glutamate ligase [Lacunisphaera limnophila]|uniref:UDP-N-acetylmuramoylalanine--D-glutamate ligase n=1 Tax=Lacunisphaera limnophila TaxID=1838286 RepID=A0A1D8AZT7_9BACT|nr:UDP-N-acetylmuramoyl-L-alanine--D-glutamate ligase [Lacunisphaera limnophila]AOS46409.1 UDP-N-acetylmuramoylalanine--D-glutamate ligase [Lacunisphaera limnophila]
MIPAPPTAITALLARPVAVLGAGVSGQGVLELLAAIGGGGVLYDEKAAGAERVFTAREAAGHGLVVFSPGFAPEHAWLATARAAGCTCLGELDFASLFWRGDLVAITGTNGKTTLTEFLTHALNAAGRRAQATGNVGYPFSRFVVEQTGRTDMAVCEVSSFQAESLQHLRPTATLWTNFAEDHLERHPGLPAYFSAKARLVARTPPGAVLVGTSVQRFASSAGLSLPASSLIPTEGQGTDARLAGTVFAGYPQYENFLLAAAWWQRTGLTEESLLAAARTFRPGAHRLARVGEKRGVTFWNDSKATNFHAVEAALATFSAPVLWIGGGKAKGGDLGAFVGRIARHIRHAFLIGETSAALAGHCRDARVPATLCSSLAAAVSAALAQAVPGEHLILSPGFASFDMFQGYDDRGRQFEALVDNL